MRRGEKVIFHKLKIHRRLDDYIIGHEPTGSYIAVDQEGVQIVEDLKHHTIAEVEKKHPRYDVQHIIDQLASKGLIHRIGHRVKTPQKHIKDLVVSGDKKISWLSKPIVKGTILAIIAIGIALMLTIPSLTPSPSWYFATQQLGALLPLSFMLFWLLQFLHETGHYLAMRATGLETRITLQHKWHMILPHTTLGNARLLEAKDAITVHTAGLIMDLLILSISIVMIQASVLPSLFKLVAVLIILEIIIQLIPFHRTDITRAIEHGTLISSLPALLKKGIKSGCPFCKGEKLTEQEDSLLKHLFPVIFVGIILTTIALFVYIIPIAFTIIMKGIEKLLAGAMLNEVPLFIDGIISLIFLSVMIALYSVSMLRNHHYGEQNWFTLLSVSIFLLANYFTVFIITSALIIFASPPTTTFLLVLLGLVYGGLFLMLIEHTHLDKKGFAHDTILPVFAAGTAIILMVMTSYLNAYTGSIQPLALHGTGYAIGMLAAMVIWPSSWEI